MKKKAILSVLRVARALGLFWLARRLTAKELRILCYHGAALLDEEKFRPGLFMRADTFRKRMDCLAKNGFPVLSLDEALSHLARETLPASGTVITIDDGWYGTFREMVPVLKRYDFPATLYISTYYLQRQTQVFNVALDYVLWRAGDWQLDLAKVSDVLSGHYQISDTGQRASASQALTRYGESLGAAARQEMLRRVCDVVGVDWEEIESRRLVSFMTEDEAREALDAGVDLQLHTHRHRFPDDTFESAKKELEDNREVLASISSRPLNHFCYPSGEYTASQLPWLDRLSIVSATTTMNGFNRAVTPRLELRRFLDSETISDLEFDAEMSGFFELVRRVVYLGWRR